MEGKAAKYLTGNIKQTIDLMYEPFRNLSRKEIDGVWKWDVD